MQLLEHQSNISDLLNLDALWHETLGDPNICIAVLDGSVDLSHPCFRGSDLTEIQTLVSERSGTGYALQHGTHVASVIFGQHDSPVRGIAPQCRGLIVPVFAEGVKGSLAPCSQLDLARAITQAVEQGANVINISGGQMSQSGQADPLLVRAVQLCAENNVLIVAAAGNDGCQCLHLPAALPTVLAVGAMDAQGLPLDFSNWGDAYQNQGILAPGENILGAVPGGTALKSGTSFATPIVSGIVALLLSLQLKQGEPPDPQAVRTAILQSALPCNQQIAEDCRRFLAGSLDLAAVQTILLKGERTTMSELNSQETPQPAEANSTGQVEASTAPLVLEKPMVTASAAISSPTQLISANVPAVTPSSSSTSVTPSEGCGCGGGGPMQLVYSLGELGYDFGTEARRDSFTQAIPPNTSLLDYLAQNPWEAQSLIWTLNLDATPIYAIMPTGPFASETYARLREFYRNQTNPVEESNRVERVSIPGYIGGSIRLLSGQTVPVIIPEVRGMFSWTVPALIDSLMPLAMEIAEQKARESGNTPPTQENVRGNVIQNIREYLERIYYDYRNLGITPQERALNFSATNAFQVTLVMIEAGRNETALDSITVEKSPICRPDSECYDIKVQFFNLAVGSRDGKVYRFTIDVSDVIPVTIGTVRSWTISR
jgi:cyanobactin maturation PatA/PatG family protease